MKVSFHVPRVGDPIVSFLDTGPCKGEPRAGHVFRIVNSDDVTLPWIAVVLDVFGDGRRFHDKPIVVCQLPWSPCARTGTWMHLFEYQRMLGTPKIVEVELAPIDVPVVQAKLDAELALWAKAPERGGS